MSASTANDPASTLLLDTLIDDASNAVMLLSDEHLTEDDINRCLSESHCVNLHVINNRFRDISCSHNERSFTFNDFVLNSQQHGQYNAVYIRIPKEKMVLQHLITLACQALTIGGSLYFTGKKNEGIKSARQFAQTIFHATASKIGKRNNAMLYQIDKSVDDVCLDATTRYQTHEDMSYPACEYITQLRSKPGQFGHQKIDIGSHLLCQQYPSIYDSFEASPTRFLDLGCGYGYLTLHSKPYPLAQRVATDNNAAALISCAKNCADNDVACDVIASDSGRQFDTTFDWIVCNPPFHRGFANDASLLNQFLENTRRLLSNRGKAVFVVNEFIPLKREASRLFNSVILLEHAQGFKVYTLSHQ